MSHNKIICVALVAALSVLVLAQDVAKSCKDVKGKDGLNATMLNGTWYELVQAPASTMGCVRTTITVINNGTELKLITSYSSSNASKLMDKRETSKLNVTILNTNTGLSVPSAADSKIKTIYKILDTDYNKFVSVCGYLESNENITFGAIFTKLPTENSTWLNTIVSDTSKMLANFTNATNINQQGCRANGASTLTMPYLTSMFAVLLAMVKLLN